jgi:hypothetical protein
MPDDLTNDQIALLWEIGEQDLSKAIGAKRCQLRRLLAEGYAEPSADRPGSALKLTSKGMAFLGERGAGLNEASAVRIPGTIRPPITLRVAATDWPPPWTSNCLVS